MTAQRQSMRGWPPAAGFTLVELMVALVVLGGGLLAMASVQIQSMQGGQLGRHYTQAATIATSQMERLQRERWTNIPVVAWTTAVPGVNVIRRSDNDMNYQVQWRITDVVVNSTRSIDVRVTWTEANSRDRSFMLSSIRNNFEAL